ncbi:type II toxin-antitoxin system Phd/YefM family antitoxin [Alicyclobacillus acidocaldarius]|uniref:Antitoxin n=1 Tax=Alicyclobacillus acidocaldarius subsp. acidocaldarius (strain ATCC 27009 / DSM 446 / BCRC 14685 / JCM 5260 / KCTC 1825 / NBRC 15652 / NCIMB 11725 / NRRL B-14509 / 104-IA) TaxID=521098 RepID=C8WUZ2_ALIAD|nr:type II toxin-antitoxin system Phd/YefM family antitoxin [Alicyclobacillus acidocaldarius]ACV57981.1 prevent-host-death family protein [Alicyclobacillus acidocaldarius subsp. acidocaldarius DSM 446]
MVREVSAMEMRKRFGDLLNEVHDRHNAIVITKAGKPVGALVDIERFEKIRMMEDEFRRMTDELAHVYADVDTAVAEDEIQEAIKASKQS